jgi:hypothetical protein
LAVDKWQFGSGSWQYQDKKMESSSGWVAVVAIDAAGQCGSNGASFEMIVAILSEIRHSWQLAVGSWQVAVWQ